MGSRASTALVVAIAAVTGGVGARGAVADVGPADGAPASPAAEHESDEPHGAGDDANPYDDNGAPRAAPIKVATVVRDGMVRVPGGRFVMGSPNVRAPANERPARPVVLRPFWIDRTEVTVGAYRACVDGGSCARPERASATCTFDSGDSELPVSCVHWRDADAYCRFASKRLPAEAEWEFASHGPYALAFPWGRVASCSTAVTLINDQSGIPCQPRPSRVGTHPAGASVYGVLDLSGNVEEWTADWYVESVGPNPSPRAGVAHVLRGGGWLSAPTMSRTTSRDWGSAIEAGPNVGFRCARDGD